MVVDPPALVADDPVVLVLDGRGAVVHAAIHGAESVAAMLVGESFGELVTPETWARLAPALELARRERAVRSIGEATLLLPGGGRHGACWLVDGRAPLRDGAVLLVGRWIPTPGPEPDAVPVAAADLVLQMRPIVDVAVGGGLRGIDAVVRRRDPERGIVWALPGVAPVADPAGTAELTRLAMTDLCVRLATWQAAGTLQHQQLVVELSPDLLGCTSLVELARRVLDDSALPASSLCLGLPEASLADTESQVVRELGRVAALGVHLALTGLGSSDSALAVLHRLPLDVVRLPGRVVQDTDPRQPSLVAGLTSLAHRLGMRVVAEGVETPEQLSVLRTAGCDATQGHLFGAAVSPGRVRRNLGLRARRKLGLGPYEPVRDQLRCSPCLAPPPSESSSPRAGSRCP